MSVMFSRAGGRAPSQLDAIVRASASSGAQGRSQAPSMSGQGVPTLLVASGRGGSGTSMIAALIAVAAAGDGRRVLLVDADDLVGPQALLLRVDPLATWQDLRGGLA